MSDVEICILAGGRSNRFGGHDKALQLLDSKPFIIHVYERCLELDLPIKVFTHSNVQRIKLAKVLPKSTKIFQDQYDSPGRTPLFGMLAAAQQAASKWIFIVPCDAIRLQPPLLRHMISVLTKSTDAIVPKWPNQWIEPLIALYSVEKLRHWIPQMLASIPPELKLKLLLKHLDRVVYLNTEELRNFDPELSTFGNINSILDLIPLMELEDPFSKNIDS